MKLETTLNFIPPEVLSDFYQDVRLMTRSYPLIINNQRKYKDGKIYIKPKIVGVEADTNNNIEGKSDEYTGEIVKYDLGVYLVKLKTGKYDTFLEEELGLFD